ncbi:hypothetical protein [Bythopirellula polymerisocia]|uniref:Secreted protein n=1 Tax=Bythopirellula polymerisocia TaxID=2528003 RepID=A0A5C6CU21_9BACT|nr:hypothetical protein [Bythopirellula polymerisocia]TWU27365.1 hypothetical protein Pla144_21370 [Bythopirellula polymerisocia]
MIYNSVCWCQLCAILAGMALQTDAASLEPVRPNVDPSAILADAESRFVQPPESWFQETQDVLRAELDRVGNALDSQGQEYAQPWKDHFHWEKLEKNLGPLETIEVSDIELSRRWMYSNRKGTEYPFFADLRSATDAYLDAAYTLSHPDLRGEFIKKAALARQQAQAVLTDPSDSNAAALGRTLGWLEKTRQLETETAILRSSMSHPNLQLVVAKPLILDVMSTQDTSVEHSLAVSDSSQTPTKRRFQRSRTVYVQGMAHTQGAISLELVPNPLLAELNIVYQGEVNSLCHATAGPISFNIHTAGPVSAFTPVTFGPEGIEVRDTAVEPQVRTSVGQVSAERNFVRRIGERRVNETESRAMMDRRSREKTVNLLKEEMDERVGSAIDDIRLEISHMRSAMGQFSEVFAPVVREGAAPYFSGTQSSDHNVTVNIHEGRREQFGAALPCPEHFPDADVVGQIHVSFVNNLLETIMAGKMFTDEYFMKYAKVLQPTLPLDLMVHARTQRWAIIADKPRPLELEIPNSNHFSFKMRIAAFEVDGERFTASTVATVRYQLKQNEFGDYYLEREGDVQLDSQLDSHNRDLLQRKLGAFFAPVLDGGGVIIPEGGQTGVLSSLELLGVQASENWLAIGYKVPQEIVNSLMSSGNDNNSMPPATTESPASEYKLPPPYAVDDTLNTYPGIR